MSADAILASTKVKDIMTAKVETVLAGTPLRLALKRMVAANVGSLIVVARQTPTLYKSDVLGLVPVFFCLRQFLTGQEDAPVEVAMTTASITVSSDASIASVIPQITSNTTWRMIVLDEDDRVAGLLSATDVMRLLRNSFEKGQ